MNIDLIYNGVRSLIAERYGTNRWCYTDYFLDEKGKAYFIEQLETDKEISEDMDDDEVIEHIYNCLCQSVTIGNFQQALIESIR